MTAAATAQPRPDRQALRRAVPLLAAANLLVVTGEFFVVGMLPALSRDLGLPLATAGRLVTAFALAAALLGPPLTLAAAALPPRRVLAASLLAFGLAGLAAACWPAYETLLVARTLQGALLPVFVSLGNAAVAGLAGHGRAGRALAQVGIGVVAGLVVAVPLGVALAERIGWTGAYLLLAAASGIAALVLAVALPPLPAEGARAPAAQAAILRRPLFHAHLLLSALFFTALFSAYSFLAAFLEQVAGFTADEAALALLGFGAAGLAGNWLGGRFVDRGPTAATAAAAAVVAGAAALLAPAAAEPLLLLPLLAVWGAAHTAAFLVCQVRVMAAAPGAPAFASSLNIAFANLGIALGALLGGSAVERFGLAAVGPLAAALALASALLAVALLRRPRRRALVPRRARGYIREVTDEPLPPEAPAIEVRELSKRFGEQLAVDRLSFAVAPGETVALLGGNGAGKTTTISMLLGLLLPSGGSVRLLGCDMARHPHRVLHRINFSSPYVDLPRRLTVAQNLRFFCRLYGVPDAAERLARIGRELDLDDLWKKRTGQLSAGQKTRVSVAKALINRPEVLLLDEPTASLDPDTADWLRAYLERYQAERRVAILLASHNMAEVERLCDRVVMMKAGRLVDEATPAALLRKYGRTNLEEVFLDIARDRRAERPRELPADGPHHHEGGEAAR